MSADLIMRQTTNGLGAAPSLVEVSSTPLNNIFDNVSPDEATAGDSEYRAIDLYNDGDEVSTATAVYMRSPTVNVKTQIEMGVEAAWLDSVTGIADESSAPNAVSFAYHNDSSHLAIGDIPVGSYARVWLKRIVDSGAINQSNDIGTIAFIYA